MSLNTQSNYGFPLTVYKGGKAGRQMISQEVCDIYAQMLAKFSSSQISDGGFRIDRIQDRAPVILNFQKHTLPDEDTLLVKCFCIHGLCIVSPKTCARYLSDLWYLFEYLDEKKTYIEALSTSRLIMFTGWLDSMPLSAEQKNHIANTVDKLIDFMQMQNLLRPGLVVFEHRWKTEVKEPVRAPERQIIEQLDLHFFNLENNVPSDMRCCYMTLRLILSRVSEALTMNLTALDYYEDDIFIVQMTSKKRQPLNIEREDEYAFCMAGMAEGIFLSALQEQQRYAEAMQDKLPDKFKGFLLVSTEHPNRLLRRFGWR